MDDQLRSFLANLSAEKITKPRPPGDSTDDEVQQALAICDAITALRITLIANAFLEAQVEELKSQVSTGSHGKKAHARTRTSANPMRTKKRA